MTAKRIAFVTADAWRELPEDDHLAVRALNERGHIVDAAVWDDPAIDWTLYDVVILRSCWDYHVKHHAFARWLDELERLNVNIWNPVETLRWNLDKIYLQEMQQNGVAITPTAFAQRGDRLREIIETRGWSDVVLKPRVSASGHRTIRLQAADADQHQPELDDLFSHGGALIQQYLPEIERDGEWSFIFLGGAFSHAARKRPAPGEFRVQLQYGGIHSAENPDPSLKAQAEAVMRGVSHPWLYARVDGCVVDGRLLLMELELLEPSLFLRHSTDGPDRFAHAIEGRLNALPDRAQM